jgi:hypothetical protein
MKWRVATASASWQIESVARSFEVQLLKVLQSSAMKKITLDAAKIVAVLVLVPN